MHSTNFALLKILKKMTSSQMHRYNYHTNFIKFYKLTYQVIVQMTEATKTQTLLKINILLYILLFYIDRTHSLMAIQIQSFNLKIKHPSVPVYHNNSISLPLPLHFTIINSLHRALKFQVPGQLNLKTHTRQTFR